MAAIIDTAHDAFLARDGAGRITHWSQPSETLFGWKRAEALGRPQAELVVPDDQRAAPGLALLPPLAQDAQPPRSQRVGFLAMRKSGQRVPVEMSVSVSGQGAGRRWLAFLHDTSAREPGDAALLAQARTDALTGLPNRRHLYDRLQETVARVARTQRLMAVLFMDIDHFKAINDS